MLRYKMKKRINHIKVINNLEDKDYTVREDMCYDLLQTVINENLMEHVPFSDDAKFHVCGTFNRYNCRIWAEEKLV